jgi:transcriptional regulator with XRE-family HTH domain
MAGVSHQTVSQIENDIRKHSSLALIKIAKALGVTVSEVAGPNQRELADLLESKRVKDGWLGVTK